jgi:hypothetical protein
VGGPFRGYVVPLSPRISYEVNYLPSVLKENWINKFTFVTSTSDTRAAFKAFMLNYISHALESWSI